MKLKQESYFLQSVTHASLPLAAMKQRKGGERGKGKGGREGGRGREPRCLPAVSPVGIQMEKKVKGKGEGRRRDKSHCVGPAHVGRRLRVPLRAGDC